MHIVLHFNIRVQSIRQRQLSEGVKFRKIYDDDEDRECMVLSPKDIQEKVIGVWPSFYGMMLWEKYYFNSLGDNTKVHLILPEFHYLPLQSIISDTRDV